MKDLTLLWNFTMEIGDHINFLNVTVIIENNVIMFDYYKKPINSGKYLNFFSYHPMKHKKRCHFEFI